MTENFFLIASLPLSIIPSINAALNATCVLLLILGYVMIRQKRITAHKYFMGSAFIVSILFLISYLIYHYQVGSVSFTGRGWIRSVYFTILISHTILALVITPMACLTIYRAIKGRYESHIRIARWTFPIWVYVSLTGVTVYLMLYQL